MLSELVKQKVNACLRKALVKARKSKGLNACQAAGLTGLTEIDFLATEASPFSASIDTLGRIMGALGKHTELFEAQWEIAEILREGNRDAPSESKVPRPNISDDP